MLSIIFFLWRTQSNSTAENLNLPLNSADEFYSSNEYSGYVYLTISGSGQIASDVYIDAFYTFDSLGGLSAEKVRRNFGFEIDNKIADVLAVGNIPEYNSRHVYNGLSYYVGDTPRLISFRVADRDVSDNEGKLTISISTELPSQYSGR